MRVLRICIVKREERGDGKESQVVWGMSHDTWSCNARLLLGIKSMQKKWRGNETSHIWSESGQWSDVLDVLYYLYIDEIL